MKMSEVTLQINADVTEETDELINQYNRTFERVAPVDFIPQDVDIKGLESIFKLGRIIIINETELKVSTFGFDFDSGRILVVLKNFRTYADIYKHEKRLFNPEGWTVKHERLVSSRKKRKSLPKSPVSDDDEDDWNEEKFGKEH